MGGGKDISGMSEDEKLEFAAGRKDVGTRLFKVSRVGLALMRYKQVIDLFGYIDNFSTENKRKAKELKQACELNGAACHLKLDNFKAAKALCNDVLQEENSNVKALFRRGQACLQLREFEDSIHDLKRVLQLDQQNREARSLLKQATAGLKEEERPMFLKMSEGFGKGPIPEPYVRPLRYPNAEKDDKSKRAEEWGKRMFTESQEWGKTFAPMTEEEWQRENPPEDDETFLENKASWPDEDEGEEES